MNDATEELLKEIEERLDTLLAGGFPAPFEAAEDSPFCGVACKLNKLTEQLSEVAQLSAELAQGNLGGSIPPRQNMLAASGKQLQSMLNVITFNVKELLKGRVVSKLEGEGNELFAAFNELVDKVSQASLGSGQDDFAMSDPSAMNSWRYHQILTAVNMLDIQIIEVDDTGKVVYTNPPARKMLNGMTHLGTGFIKENTEPLIAHFCHYSSPDMSFPVVREIIDEENARWFRATSDTFTLPNGQVFFLHVADDITDWKLTEEKLSLSANFDSLTGTLNRRAGLNMLKMLHESNSEEPNCIAFIDVDGLKAVNDSYGHAEGDNYLRIVANTLTSSVRSSESVIRYGGDEFFILFKNCTLENSRKVIMRMVEKLDALNHKKLKPYNMSFSYGVEVFGDDNKGSPEQLLHSADSKMYRQKAEKKRKLR